MSSIKETKTDVLNAAQAMIEEGLNFGTWGNISCRAGDELVVITPSGVPYDHLQEKDLCVVDLQGKARENRWKPSTELPLHLAVYRGRKDIRAVVHVHSKYAAAFAVARREIPVVLEEMAQVLGAAVPVAPYALPGSSLLGDYAVSTLGAGYAVLLPAHGLVTVGVGYKDALLRCQVIERSACILLFSRLLGNPVLLEDNEIAALHEKYVCSYGPKLNDSEGL